MRVTRVLSITGCVAAFMFGGACFAQNTNKFAFSVGGGFTEPVSHSDGRFDPGFNIGAGAGYNFHPNFGVMADFGFNHLGVSSSTLSCSRRARRFRANLFPHARSDRAFQPQGQVRCLRDRGRRILPAHGRIHTAGSGDDHGVRSVLRILSRRTSPPTSCWATFTQNKGGLNIGGGVSMRLRGDSNTKFFAEARYHYIFTSPIRTAVLPVTFGLRW